MLPSVAETVKDYAKRSAQFRASINRDPGIAKQMLLKAGIAVKRKSGPNGMVLASRYRP